MSRSSQPQTKEFEELSHLRNGVNGKVTAQPTAALDELDELMPRSQAGLRVSEEEYWQFYYQHLDFNYEWNDGILEQKPLAKVRGSQQYQWFLLCLDFCAVMRARSFSEKLAKRPPQFARNPVLFHLASLRLRSSCDRQPRTA